MADLAALVVRMQADNSQYIKALEQATGKLETFEKEQEGALSELKEQFSEIGGKIAAAFTVDKLIEFTSEAIESAASLEKMSQSTGIGVEALGALRLAAAASGLSQDDLGVALKKLNVNVSEAAGNINSKAAVAFGALGIKVTDANGKLRDAGEILPDLAEKFSKMEDGPNKVAFAVALLGKQGQQMIPVLNEGRKGLEEFEAKAKAAGFTTAETAAQAEEFEKKLNILKATLVDSLGAQLTAKVVPTLSALIDVMSSNSSTAQFFSGAATVLSGVLKVGAIIVIELAREFKILGDIIGSTAAAINAAAHGNVREAFETWNQNSLDNVATSKKAWDDIVDITEAGTENELSAISTAEAEKKKIPKEGPSLAEAEKIKAAVLKLDDYNKALQTQAATFGLGKQALIDYDLQFGTLSKDVKEAGAAGAEFVKQIKANAAALQTKTDLKLFDDTRDKLQENIIKFGQSDLAAQKFADSTGELGKALDRMADHGAAARAQLEGLAKADILLKDAEALEAIDRETLTMTGHLHDAAAAAFDFQNKLLIKNLADTGNTAGEAKLAILKQQTLAQADFNQQVANAELVNEGLRKVESDIELARTKGQITDMAAEEQLQIAREKTIAQLKVIEGNEQAIAAASGDPKLVASANAFALSIQGIQKQTDALEASVRDNLEKSFANNFENLIDGSESFKKSVMGMLKDLDKMFLDMIAKDYAQKFFGTGGPAGGAAGLLSSLFKGAGGGGSAASGLVQNGGAGGGIGNIVDGFADGGTIPLGKMGLVGEEGPELAYAGSQNLNIAPISSASAKPITVHNQFMIEAPGGTISRQSQMQTAAAAARSLSQANRRNNA